MEELKREIQILKLKVELYETSTRLDYIKINKLLDYIDDLEKYNYSLECKNIKQEQIIQKHNNN
jgi:hypothetical protein